MGKLTLKKLDEIKKLQLDDDFLEELMNIPEGMAAVFEKDNGIMRQIRSFLSRRHVYEKFRTFTDDENFYVAKRGADKK